LRSQVEGVVTHGSPDSCQGDRMRVGPEGLPAPRDPSFRVRPNRRAWLTQIRMVGAGRGYLFSASTSAPARLRPQSQDRRGKSGVVSLLIGSLGVAEPPLPAGLLRPKKRVVSYRQRNCRRAIVGGDWKVQLLPPGLFTVSVADAWEKHVAVIGPVPANRRALLGWKSVDVTGDSQRQGLVLFLADDEPTRRTFDRDRGRPAYVDGQSIGRNPGPARQFWRHRRTQYAFCSGGRHKK